MLHRGIGFTHGTPTFVVSRHTAAISGDRSFVVEVRASMIANPKASLFTRFGGMAKLPRGQRAARFDHEVVVNTLPVFVVEDHETPSELVVGKCDRGRVHG